MSSARKEARWQLAHDRVDEIGLSWDQLTTVGQTKALELADQELDTMSEADIEIFAERWNAPPFDPADKKALEVAIGYDLVDISIDGHPDLRKTHRTTTDRDQLVERILAAGFTKKA